MSEVLLEIVVDKDRPGLVCFRDETIAELPAAVSIADMITAFQVQPGKLRYMTTDTALPKVTVIDPLLHCLSCALLGS